MLNLNDREWRPFFLTELFPQIQRGKRLKTENHIPGKTPYVSSSALRGCPACFLILKGVVISSHETNRFS